MLNVKLEKQTTKHRRTGLPTTPPSGGDAANSVKRRAFERMKKIYGLLQDGKYPNCTSMSPDFEVSMKTAARDSEFTRGRWSLPIGCDDKWHGSYFTEKVDRLPLVPVSEAELFAVGVWQPVSDHGDLAMRGTVLIPG